MKKNLKVFTALTLALGLTVLAGCGSKSNVKENGDTTTKEEYTYKNNDYLVDINWLQDNLKNEDLILIDTRVEKDYNAGHIPGAINAVWQSFANMTGKSGDKGWGVLLDEKALSEKFSKLGIDKDKKVIVYANKDGWGEDGRLLWMFKRAGIDAKILNGGIDLWNSEKKEISKESVTPKQSNYVVEKLSDNMNITTDQLKENLDKVKIVDSRAKDEFNGAIKFGEAKGGHLPKAISLPFTEVYNGDGTIKNKTELEKIFKDAGLSKDDEIVTYCTAGIRSAHLALMLDLAGYKNVKNYDASFYEWAGDSSNSIEK